MKNKGFTLIELLCAIAVLGILTLLLVPVVSKRLNESRINVMIIQENKIKDASGLLIEDYCNNPINDEYKQKCDSLLKKSESSNIIINGEEIEEKYICIDDIRNEGYYDEDLLFSGEKCHGFVVYQYEKNSNKVKSSKTYITCGKSYFTKEIENNDIDINDYPNCSGTVYPTKYYYLVYNANNGQNVPAVEQCLYSKKGNSVLPNCTKQENYKLMENTFSKTNYDFVNWNTSPDGSGITINESDSLPNELQIKRKNNEKINLYAIWEKTKPLEEEQDSEINIAKINCNPLYKNGIKVTSSPKETSDIIYGGACEVFDDENGNWRVKLYGDETTRSGTYDLTFNKKTKIDVFLVGGGGGGSSSVIWDFTYGIFKEYIYGAGGGGGYVKTIRNIDVNIGTIDIEVGSGGVPSSGVVVSGDYSTNNQGTDGGKSCFINCATYSADGGKLGETAGLHTAWYWNGGKGGDGGSGGGGAGTETSSGACASESPGIAGTNGNNGSNGCMFFCWGSQCQYSNTARPTGGSGAKNASGNPISTREFGDSSLTLYSSGGRGIRSDLVLSKTKIPNTGDGGDGQGYGASGVVIIRNKR